MHQRTIGRARGRRVLTARELASGFLTVALLACGQEGDGPVSPPAPAVAAVRVEAPAGPIRVGETLRLDAVALDAGGEVVPDAAFAWSSSDAEVARVDASGRVTARAAGTTEIRASAEGRDGTAAVRVLPAEAATVVATPPLLVLDVGAEGRVAAAAYAASGDSLADATFAWASLASAVAGVDDAGRVRGVAPGIAWIVARSGSLADSVVTAVLGPGSVLARALPGGAARAEISAGEPVPVTLRLDLSRVSPSGDLGSVEVDLRFDPAVLRFDSVRVELSGAGDFHLASPGRLRLAFAATAAQGSPDVALATVFLSAAPDAPAGSRSRLDLEFAESPRSTGFVAYPAPVAAPGRVRVVGRP